MVLRTSDNMVGRTARYFGPMRHQEVNLVMIICNHCPYVLFRMPAISQLVRDYRELAQIVAVNSNDHTPDTPDSKAEDSPDLMPAFVERWDLRCDYIYDADQSIARDYGALCTPEFYVVGRDGVIAYHGELDPSHTSNRLTPTGSSLRHALDLVLAGKHISWTPNPSFGCSVKWRMT